MKRNKKTLYIIVLILVVVIVSLTIAFAALSTTFTINFASVNQNAYTWNVQFESDVYYVENVSLWMDIKQVFKTVQVVLTKSEMRTNSDRVKFNGQNLNETRTRSQIIAEEGEEGLHTPPKYIVEDKYL